MRLSTINDPRYPDAAPTTAPVASNNRRLVSMVMMSSITRVPINLSVFSVECIQTRFIDHFPRRTVTHLLFVKTQDGIGILKHDLKFVADKDDG